MVLTGASGALGRAILRQVSGRPDIAILALYRETPPKMRNANVESAAIALSDKERLTTLLKAFSPTLFIHAAATGMQIPRPDDAILEAINARMPARLAEIVSRIKGCSFLQVSSGLAYKDQGRPLREEDPLETRHPYGASKAEAEKELGALALRTGLPLNIARPFSFTGQGDAGTRFFPSLLRCASEKTPFEMSTGHQVRDHCSVDDVAAGVLAAAHQRGHAGVPQIYNLGSGDTRTLRQLLGRVIEQLGLKVEVRSERDRWRPTSRCL